jgi:hypothetical protein
MSNFKLTRSEFSKKLGIPTDTLKKRMKRGHYKDQFIFENGKYLFSGDVRDGPKLVNNKPMSPGTKRVRNRGNHFDSKNPNYKQEILPEAIEIAKQQKRERLRRELETPLKKPYTTGIYNASYGSSYVNNMSPIAHKRNPLNFRSTNRGTTRFKKGPYEI